MGDEVHIWRVDDGLTRADPAALDLESRLPGVAGERHLGAGSRASGHRQEVATDFDGYIDLLCIDSHGGLVAVELKRDRTAREVTAQALDYASWVVDLSNDRVATLVGTYLGVSLDEAFQRKFGRVSRDAQRRSPAPYGRDV